MVGGIVCGGIYVVVVGGIVGGGIRIVVVGSIVVVIAEWWFVAYGELVASFKKIPLFVCYQVASILYFLTYPARL